MLRCAASTKTDLIHSLFVCFRFFAARRTALSCSGDSRTFAITVSPFPTVGGLPILGFCCDDELAIKVLVPPWRAMKLSHSLSTASHAGLSSGFKPRASSSDSAILPGSVVG